MSNGRRHSPYLQRYFDISPFGIDYHNDYNVAFEFKETFALKIRSQFFRIPHWQVDESDYLVFIIYKWFPLENKYSEYCYIVRAEEIEYRYSFNNKNKFAFIRVEIVKEMCFMEFSSVFKLREFIHKLKK